MYNHLRVPIARPSRKKVCCHAPHSLRARCRDHLTTEHRLLLARGIQATIVSIAGCTQYDATFRNASHALHVCGTCCRWWCKLSQSKLRWRIMHKVENLEGSVHSIAVIACKVEAERRQVKCNMFHVVLLVIFDSREKLYQTRTHTHRHTNPPKRYQIFSCLHTHRSCRQAGPVFP